MKATELGIGRSWLIRLDTDGPMYSQILEAATTLGVRAAQINVFGAVQNVAIRYFDQDAKEYRDLDIDQHMELLGGVGNISTRDGSPFLHCHITGADTQGRAFGGHLHETKETKVFVGEVWMQELLGEPPVRVFDERCGLALW